MVLNKTRITTLRRAAPADEADNDDPAARRP